MNTPPKTHRGRRMLAPSGASSFLLVPESDTRKNDPMNTPPKTHGGRRTLAPSGAASFLSVPESESPKKRPKITFQN